jgi:hypothetical protein
MSISQRKKQPRIISLSNSRPQQCPGCGNLTQRIVLVGSRARCPRCLVSAKTASEARINKRLFLPEKRELRPSHPVRQNRVCLACKRPFSSKHKDARYCSPRCQKRAKREQEAQHQQRERERLLTASRTSPPGADPAGRGGSKGEGGKGINCL